MSIKKIVASSVAVIALGTSLAATAGESTTSVKFGNMDGASTLPDTVESVELAAGAPPGSPVRFPWMKPDFHGEGEMSAQDKKVVDAIERALLS